MNGEKTTCLFCDNERALKPGCINQRWLVCRNHFMQACPKCGHEVFWMENRMGGGCYMCFRVGPWCNWTSETPPHYWNIRWKSKQLTPFNQRYYKGQTKAHSVFSPDGHEWDEAEQCRVCIKCCLVQCNPLNWVPVPHETFSTEDIHAMIAQNERSPFGVDEPINNPYKE